MLLQVTHAVPREAAGFCFVRSLATSMFHARFIFMIWRLYFVSLSARLSPGYWRMIVSLKASLVYFDDAVKVLP